jgi:hypothetical protein
MLLSVYCFSSTNIFDIVFEMVSNAHILAMMVNSIEQVYLYSRQYSLQSYWFPNIQMSNCYRVNIINMTSLSLNILCIKKVQE